MAYVSVSIGLFAVLCLILMKHFSVAVLLLMMRLPLVIGIIGMYLDNTFLLFGGLILFFIMLPIVIKLAERGEDE